MVEIGPHLALAGLFKQIRKAYDLDRLTYVASLIRDADSSLLLLKTAGELFLQNYEVDLERVNAAERMSENGGFPKAVKLLTLLEADGETLSGDHAPYLLNEIQSEGDVVAEVAELTHHKTVMQQVSLSGLVDRTRPVVNKTRSLTPSVDPPSCKEVDQLPDFKHTGLSVEIDGTLIAHVVSGEQPPREIESVTLFTVDKQASQLDELPRSLATVSSVDFKLLQDLDRQTDANVIIVDFDGNLLVLLAPEMFAALKGVVASGKPIVWIISRVNEGPNVSGGMSPGFLRTMLTKAMKSSTPLLTLSSYWGKSEPKTLESTRSTGCTTRCHTSVELLNARVDPAAEPLTEATLLPGKALHGSYMDEQLAFFEDTHLSNAPVEPSEVVLQVWQVLLESNPTQRSTAPQGTSPNCKIRGFTDAFSEAS
ncbi:hypothetical protein SLS56_012197 [Neofusicoccum ribis]|uniref:Uncharacterized protein n=1 Tax=Neofusicoccum ribis TaxID=45134 RepID=A0ABR3SAJ1_9PEZI